MRPCAALTVPDIRDVPVFIYGLCEPTGEIRYIGKSAHPERRVANHKAQGAELVRDWIASLAAAGKSPGLVKLRTVPPGEDAAAAEAEEIARHSATLDLLNCIGVLPARGRPKGARSSAMPPATNEGERLLREALPNHGDASRLADEMGIGQPVVSRWLRGRRPVTASRLFLERRLGIPADAWDQTPVQEGRAA